MPRLRRGVIRERATRHAYSWRGLAGCRRRCSRATREVRTPLQNKLWVPGLFLSSALSLCGVSCMICRICRDGGNTFTPERYRLELISAHIHRETGPQRPTHSFWSFLFENYTHTHTNDELSDDFSLRGPFREKEPLDTGGGRVFSLDPSSGLLATRWPLWHQCNSFALRTAFVV